METHMIELRVDALRLMRLARDRRLPRRQVDLGYLTHCQLGETFGDASPSPFAILTPSATARELTVLGYAALDAATLSARASEVAPPERHAGIDWGRLASKPMPSSWTAGRRLGFEVRACPVARMASAGAHHRQGAEVDAFLRACWRAGPEVPVDRESVYRAWLAERLAARGARAMEIEIDSFQVAPVTRRDHVPERSARVMRRPDVRFGGVLEVTDGELFGSRLAAGIGRHRAFGFGMLLLRPAP